MKDQSISVFTPSNNTPEELEFILVQRRDLLADAVERVRESALTDHKHHLLFVGPRGCGKTFLLTLIVHRLSLDAELSDRLRIAWLNEDETCTTLLEFLLKIHAALQKRYPKEFDHEGLAPAFEMKPDAALEFVSTLVLDALGSRTLMVGAENLDAIFENLGDAGQKQLRSFIQENPRLCLVATAQRLVEGLSKRTNPFYGSFQTEHLKPLSVEDATELLKNIARLNKNDKVVQFLSTSRGRSRVQALHHLSGGNHRIYIVLSQFIREDNVDTLVGPFMKMVDELTPYYQERVRWLPPLQRKIVEFLCACETTVPVKEIAKRLFSTPQTISSQLLGLRAKGYVESNQSGRESLYEIREPLMRICVEVKENQRHQPLRLLVDFLRIWYDDHELKHRLGNMASSTTSRAYLESAIKRNNAEGNLRKRFLLQDLRSSLAKNTSPELRTRILADCAGLPEEAVLGVNHWAEGRNEDAIACLTEAIRDASIASKLAASLFARAQIHGAIGNPKLEIDDFTTLIDLPDVPLDLVATALLNRGVAYGTTGESQLAIDDYTTLLDLPAAPADRVATALYNRGVTYGQSEESQRAIDDFTTLIGLPAAPVNLVARALYRRGSTYGLIGMPQLATDDYTTLIVLPGAPAHQVAQALYNRGASYAETERQQLAIDDFTTLINLTDLPVDLVATALYSRGATCARTGKLLLAIEDFTTLIGLPGTPVNLVAMALLYRGTTYSQTVKTQSGIGDYTTLIALPGAPVEQVAMALLNRGVTYGNLEETQREIDDYTTLIGLPGAPVEHVAMALNYRGATHYQMNQMQEAQRDLESIIDLANAPGREVVNAYLSLSKLHWSKGKWTEGFETLKTGLAYGGKLESPYSGGSIDLISMLFAAGLNPESRHEKVSALFEAYQNHQFSPVLGEGLIKHLGWIFQQGAPYPSSDNLEQWYTAWEKAASDTAEFGLPLRLLRTGIDFVIGGGKDQAILLHLTSAERKILRQALGLDNE
jgi:tetratricopeptide (TPR) repeat protein